jgi:hypothetical protein
MKTDALIAALAADSRSLGRPLGRAMLVGAVGGAIASAVLLQVSIGVRPDIIEALGTWRFLLKMTLLLAAIALVARTSLPVSRPIAIAVWPLCIALAALFVGAVAAELIVTPRTEWTVRWLGSNAMVCVVAIPALSAVPLALLLMLMRNAAPASPTQAGAMIGALAAAVCATLYGTHCVDDSPLFVATWYACGAVPVVALGAVLGRRILRW